MKRRGFSYMGDTSTSNGGGDSTMKSSLNIPHTASTIIDNDKNNGSGPPPLSNPSLVEHDDRFNYALLLALYTLQGIPMVRVEIYWKKLFTYDMH